MFITVILCFAVFYTSYSCAPIPHQAKVMGNHGWKVWENESFVSFEPAVKRYCVPGGWEAIGATVDRFGNATFPAKSTGVIVKTEGFTTKTLPLGGSSNSVQVRYPKNTPEQELAGYFDLIYHSFIDVGQLYPNFHTEQLKTHTVLITVGLAGDGSTFETSVYPNPSKDLTVFVRNKNHARGEELFTHAVTHIFNRHFEENLEYEKNQTPVPADDWQELEATWSEITFRSGDDAREQRVKDLYAIHEAVFDATSSPSLTYPFDDPKIFSDVHNKAVMQREHGGYAEEQYGHYVLAPLVMLAVDGMLEQKHSPTTVNLLLIQIHTENKNFFALLKEYLSEDETSHVLNFLTGKEKIPYELLQSGLQVRNASST